MASIDLKLTDDQRALKAGITEICKRYPGEYWRDLDSRPPHPATLVNHPTPPGQPRRPDPAPGRRPPRPPPPPGGRGRGAGRGRGRADLRDDPRHRRQPPRLPRPDVH